LGPPQLSEADAILCQQGRENEASITVQEIKSLRQTIANVSDAGTRVYHVASEFLRYEVMRLMNKGVPASKAYSIVQKQHVESEK